METFKGFVFIYAIFTVILTLLGLNAASQYMSLTLPTEITLISIIDFLGSIVTFAYSILFYSTGYFIIDAILWAMRIISTIELIYFGKKLVNPASN